MIDTSMRPMPTRYIVNFGPVQKYYSHMNN